jgi:hypothetical protein
MDSSGGAPRALNAASDLADHAAWQPEIDLALTISGSRQIGRGRTAHLRVALRDLSPAPAFDVTLSGVTSPGVRVERARISILGTPSALAACPSLRPLLCRLYTLASADAVAVDLTLRPRRCGRLDIRQSVAAWEMDPNSANNRARFRLHVSC